MAWHHWPNDSPEFHPGLEDILSQHHGGKHHREGDPPVHALHQLSGVRGAYKAQFQVVKDFQSRVDFSKDIVKSRLHSIQKIKLLGKFNCTIQFTYFFSSSFLWDIIQLNHLARP